MGGFEAARRPATRAGDAVRDQSGRPQCPRARWSSTSRDGHGRAQDHREQTPVELGQRSAPCDPPDPLYGWGWFGGTVANAPVTLIFLYRRLMSLRMLIAFQDGPWRRRAGRAGLSCPWAFRRLREGGRMTLNIEPPQFAVDLDLAPSRLVEFLADRQAPDRCRRACAMCPLSSCWNFSKLLSCPPGSVIPRPVSSTLTHTRSAEPALHSRPKSQLGVSRDLADPPPPRPTPRSSRP